MNDATDFFPGGGEMGARVRAFEWARTPIGPVETWPSSLRTAVRIILDSRYPMFVWWGEELTNIYNDSYSEILGQRHPAALGRPAQATWSDIWDTVGPLARTVVDEARATFNNELELFMERNGYVEETYFTFSYSPLSDAASGVRGLFCACIEDTERVVGERRLRLLRALGSSGRTARSVAEVLDSAMRAFQRYRRDVAFAIAYRHEGDELVLAAAENATDLAPARIELGAAPAGRGDGIEPGPLAAVFADGKTRVLDARDVGRLMPGGEWPEPASHAMILPLTGGGEERTGVLVLGACPRRPFDDTYRQFFELVANAVSSLVTSADAYENERRRADALAELDRAKTVFFGNVSHEFRTPLTLMMAPIEDLLLEASLPASAREQLEIARRNGLRLVKLVNTLLDFSRIEAGRITARYEPVDLCDTTTELASMFRSAIEATGLDFEVQCEPLGEPVYVDRDMWEKIVMNLLSNALKYTLEGAVSVQLRRADEQFAELLVRDTGIGIPEDELPRVFERFHRVEGAHGRTQEGTGIGLALVRELCQLHGGEVTVDSRVGEGSTFRVRIPFGAAHLPAERISAAAAAPAERMGVEPFLEEAMRWLPESVGMQGSGATGQHRVLAPERGLSPKPLVLVADDNADMRAYLRRLLSPRFELLVAADGPAALSLAEEHLPALVLSDIMMPGLDGFELLARLRSNPATRPIPVVLLSARAGEEARAEGLEAGADDYIVKPFHARELIARVGAQIELANVRRGAELRVTALLEGSTAGFTIIDADGRYQYVNPAAERLIGYNREEMIGRRPEEVFPEAVGSESLDLLHKVMQTRVPESAETYFEPWDRWFRIKIDPTRDGGVTTQFDDVTLARRALQTMRETDQRKDEFLATLAHELRNPLAPIRNALELLLRDKSIAPEPLYEMMERQTGQLTRLVNDLMEVSRINRGMVELRRERIAVASAIESACETVRPDLEERAQQFDVVLPAEPVYVDADPVRLAQVVANLLGNASKYTPDGGRVQLVVEASDSEVEIAVTDDGIGIAPDQVETLFEPFLQAGNVAARERGGLGLGLTVVRELVQRHGGTVSAASPGPGLGSTFRVTLPRVPAEVRGSAPAEAASGSPRADAAARERQPGTRVVVCDDNRDAADSLAMLLRERGCSVTVAYDGESALDAVADSDPELVILDIGLPDIDGTEVARRIRERDVAIDRVLVALTGWGQETDRAETTEAGFDYHLVKPADWSEIAAILERHTAGDASPGH